MDGFFFSLSCFNLMQDPPGWKHIWLPQQPCRLLQRLQQCPGRLDGFGLGAQGNTELSTGERQRKGLPGKARASDAQHGDSLSAAVISDEGCYPQGHITQVESWPCCLSVSK